MAMYPDSMFQIFTIYLYDPSKLDYYHNNGWVGRIGGNSWYDVCLRGCCVGLVGRLFWRSGCERWWLFGLDLEGSFHVSSFPCNEKLFFSVNTKRKLLLK